MRIRSILIPGAAGAVALAAVLSGASSALAAPETSLPPTEALVLLEELPVQPWQQSKYERDDFPHWQQAGDGCDTRQMILRRDLTDVTLRDDGCTVGMGMLADPYSGKNIRFQHTNFPTNGAGDSSAVQIDHVVALSDAWRTGANLLTLEQRTAFANDPLNLIAVDGPTNNQKSDSNAVNWLPSWNGGDFDCEYTALQVQVKSKYSLWVTKPEHDALRNALTSCAEEDEVTPPSDGGTTPPTTPPGTTPPTSPPTTPPATGPEQPEPGDGDGAGDMSGADHPAGPAIEVTTPAQAAPADATLAHTGTDFTTLAALGAAGLVGASVLSLLQLRRSSVL